jgi:pyruvate dehydrogenase E2 component (dihydrolipoamide acetyltransferase)
MSVSVSMPQLGESVTEGTVTRWLKREGEHVEADEPLLEVSTDKVDTEIPSPVSGVLRGITVAEDETVAVGAELAVIDEDGAGGQSAVAEVSAPPAEAFAPVPAEAAAPAAAAQPEPEPAAPPEPEPAPAAEAAPYPQAQPSQAQPSQAQPSQEQPSYAAPSYAPPEPEPAPAAPEPAAPAAGYAAGNEPPAAYAVPADAGPADTGPAYAEPTYAEPTYAEPAYAEPAYTGPAAAAPAPAPGYDTGNGAAAADGGGFAEGPDGPYVTPLVRKLAAEHGIDLASVAGTGVGGRIRKQDVLDAARVARGPDAQQLTPQAAAPSVAAGTPAAPVTTAPVTTAPVTTAPVTTAPVTTAPVTTTPVAAPVSPAPAFPVPAYQAPAPGPTPIPATPRSPIVPSSLRGTTERMSRARQVIAQRMVESLQTSAQLTTVVEADVTAIARLRDRARPMFEAREGVKLSFLPFFALATVEALKVHPKLNAVIDTASGQVTYHDAEHLGIAVDTERGLMVPVIRNAGDLNIGGLARKIATFTLTNTGSRGALFDTPIINQPQVGILGTGTVVKRAVVVEDPTLGEVITVRSMVYLALTYDHRLVDGADAARFLVTMKSRLEEGAFETELGL